MQNLERGDQYFLRVRLNHELILKSYETFEKLNTEFLHLGL